MSEFSPRKKISFKSMANGVVSGTYNFVQPKAKGLVKPLAIFTLGATALLGYQNKSEVKSAVDPETNYVSASLLEEPQLLASKVVPLDENSEQRFLGVFEAPILLCDETGLNGEVCTEDTVFYDFDDIQEKKVAVEGNLIKIDEDLLKENQTRPWTLYNKER